MKGSAKHKLALMIVVAVATLGICSVLWPLPKFEPGRWRSGTKSSRGAMVEDLIAKGLLVGMTRSEVLQILGQPDYCGIPVASSPDIAAPAESSDPRVDWFGYKVVTISRCYFWECRMNVNFDHTTYRVESLTVSD
jgi:hypothetical protein